MNKTKLLKIIKKAMKENDTDLQSDSETEMLFHDIELEYNLPFNIEMQYTGDESWLEVYYHSNTLNKCIVWNHEVGNFDDTKEIADFIIRTTNEINDFESRITLK